MWSTAAGVHSPTFSTTKTHKCMLRAQFTFLRKENCWSAEQKPSQINSTQNNIIEIQKVCGAGESNVRIKYEISYNRYESLNTAFAG